MTSKETKTVRWATFYLFVTYFIGWYTMEDYSWLGMYNAHLSEPTPPEAKALMWLFSPVMVPCVYGVRAIWWFFHTLGEVLFYP
jgi:hypothetical protein